MLDNMAFIVIKHLSSSNKYTVSQKYYTSQTICQILPPRLHECSRDSRVMKSSCEPPLHTKIT